MTGLSFLTSKKSSNCPVSADLQSSPGASGLPIQQVPMDFQVSSESHDSPNDARTKQMKRNVFSKEQQLFLKKEFDECKYVNKKRCMSLVQRLGMMENQIKTWFKNRRARERQKKGQQLPGRMRSEPHNGPTYPSSGEVPDFAASRDFVSQRNLDGTCPPQFRLSSNSSHQESNLTFIDQPLEEMCFRKSHVTGKHQRQKCRELPRKPGHLSSDRSELSNVASPPDVSASTDSMCEIPSGSSFPPLLRPSNITQDTESTFSMCQTPSCVSPLPELTPLSNNQDQMAIFSMIDWACEIYQENTRSKKQRKHREKAIVQIWKQGQDSCATPSSPEGTDFLPTSACEDALGERQSVFRTPPCSPTSASLDSESTFSSREGTSHVSSPPLSPSMFSDPESNLPVAQTKKDLLCDALMSAKADQNPATQDSILGQTTVCDISAHPTAAQDPAIDQTPQSRITLADEYPRKNSFHNTLTLTEDVEDQTAMQDQLFLEHLSYLDAALEQLPLHDFTELF